MSNKRQGQARAAASLRSRLLLATTIALLAQGTHAEEGVVPRLGVTAMWVDNLELVGPGQAKKEDYIGQITPGLRYEHEGRRVQTFVDYEAQALFYESDSDLNEVYHQGTLGLDLVAIPDWFFVDIGGRYSQSIVDPQKPGNRNNLFAVGNVVDTAAGTVTPALRHSFASVDMTAEYSRGIVDYRDPGATDSPGLVGSEDSDTEMGRFALNSRDEDARLTWATGYRYERVEFDQTEPFEYERAEAELGLRMTDALRLIGRAGLESDPLATAAEGGLDESFWQGGFAWRRDERNEFRALIGERFFGTSYEGLLRLGGRVLSAEAGYNEEPTTEAQRRARETLVDAAEAIETPLDPNVGRIEASVYLLKRLHGQVAITGRFTEIALNVIAETREYPELAGVKDRFESAHVRLNRKFGPRTSAEIGASVVKGKLREGEDYDDQVYRLTLTRTLGRKASVVLSGNHLERSGELQKYDANWLSLGLQLTF